MIVNFNINKYLAYLILIQFKYINEILTLRTQTVRLQHHRTPFESSHGILFLDKICLKSDNFKWFINIVLRGRIS